jgi:hypothetical protein
MEKVGMVMNLVLFLDLACDLLTQGLLYQPHREPKSKPVERKPYSHHTDAA